MAELSWLTAKLSRVLYPRSTVEEVCLIQVDFQVRAKSSGLLSKQHQTSTLYPSGDQA